MNTYRAAGPQGLNRSQHSCFRSQLPAASLIGRPVNSRQRRAQCRASANGLAGCKLVGVGSSAPAGVLSNADLEKFVETNDEWIRTRTGIARRHILDKEESMADHAAKACLKALEMAGVAAEEIDLVLLATSTPDDAFGSACQVGVNAISNRV